MKPEECEVGRTVLVSFMNGKYPMKIAERPVLADQKWAELFLKWKVKVADHNGGTIAVSCDGIEPLPGPCPNCGFVIDEETTNGNR